MSKKLTALTFAVLLFGSTESFGSGMLNRAKAAMGINDPHADTCKSACTGKGGDCVARCMSYAKCIAKHPDGKKSGACPKFRA